MHDSAGADDWSTRHCARAFAAHPDILERYLAFYYPFHASDAGSVLDSRIKELVRLRIATLNGCKTCKAARLAPAQVSEREAAVGVNGGGIMLHARRPGGPVAAAQKCATHGPLSVATRGRRCTAWSSMRRFDWRLSTRV